MKEQIQQNLKQRSTWERLFYLVLFLFIFTFVQTIVFFVTFVQFFIVIGTSQPNLHLQNFGLHLTNYISQVMFFLTYNEEEKPFPFGPWPTRHRYRSSLPK